MTAWIIMISFHPLTSVLSNQLTTDLKYIFNSVINTFQSLELQRATLNTLPSFQSLLFLQYFCMYGNPTHLSCKIKTPESSLTSPSLSFCTQQAISKFIFVLLAIHIACTLVKVFIISGSTTVTSFINSLSDTRFALVQRSHTHIHDLER